jgi:hypothetical protein
MVRRFITRRVSSSNFHAPSGPRLTGWAVYKATGGVSNPLNVMEQITSFFLSNGWTRYGEAKANRLRRPMERNSNRGFHLHRSDAPPKAVS